MIKEENALIYFTYDKNDHLSEVLVVDKTTMITQDENLFDSSYSECISFDMNETKPNKRRFAISPEAIFHDFVYDGFSSNEIKDLCFDQFSKIEGFEIYEKDLRFFNDRMDEIRSEDTLSTKQLENHMKFRDEDRSVMTHEERRASWLKKGYLETEGLEFSM